MDNRLYRIAELTREIDERQRELKALIDEIIADQEPEASEPSEPTEPSELSEPTETSELSETSEPSEPSEPSESSECSEYSEPEPEPAKPVSDIRKAFTINDRFRFRRELFAGDDSAFMAVLDNLAKCSTLAEADDYLAGMPWDRDSDIIAEFMAVVANHFNGYRL